MCHFFTLKYNSVENKGDTMKKLISDYEDEKVDALIRKAVKEEAENINAPDRIKEEIDEKIGRNHIMSKNVNN